MLIELNRFLTTVEVVKEYRVPEFLADEILPNLPVVATSPDGIQFHLEEDVDEFLSVHFGQSDKALPSQHVTDILSYGCIGVNKTDKEVTIDDKTYPLDEIRLDVLVCLVANKGGWVTRADMRQYSRNLQQEERLDRVVKCLKARITVLNGLIESSSRGYRVIPGTKVE
jgi:DNA-binding response OmpR family regulator